MDYKSEVEISWKANIIEGDNPVHEINHIPSGVPEYCGVGDAL